MELAGARRIAWPVRGGGTAATASQARCCAARCALARPNPHWHTQNVIDPYQYCKNHSGAVQNKQTRFSINWLKAGTMLEGKLAEFAGVSGLPHVAA